MTSSPSGALRLELDIPAEARVGDAIPIVLRVTNTGSDALDLYLRGREITFDVVASSGDGKVVWRRLENAIVPAILRIETLEPNAPMELRTRWRLQDADGAPVPPGAYALLGTLFTDGPELHTPPAILRVLAP